MKILLLTVGTINYNCDINFYEPLKDIGDSVIRYNYIERLNDMGRRRMNREVLALAESENPDFIFFITYRDEISRKTLARLRERGHKVVGWFSDDHWRFDDYSRHLARNLFCSITTDSKAVDKYKNYGFNVIKSQWASNPEYYHPVESSSQYEVTFVGQSHGIRGEVIDFLKQNEIPVEPFGKGWGSFLPFEEIITIFSNSKINLNISASSRDPQRKQIKGRVFEVPMCGGFLLTDYVDELENYFDIGREIVCYKDREDLVQKIKYYLEHENERRQIAENGYRACLEQHPWINRFRDILKELNTMPQPEPVPESFFDTIRNIFH